MMNVGTALLVALAAVYAGSLVFVIRLVSWSLAQMKQQGRSANG